ncbi:BTB/POZ domain-containing protein [Ditylenchus destructor]|uniref:BTB/POZ domain-containing protein n=1 Tax=Ditylenchus destructor TaxID=166010 RepID=A0AAD4MH01_9BILA|nr:BTB/POZ domain-containing protein [Ditylenchus destructor]
MSDSADFKNDYSDFVIVAEHEWSRRKEERWNVYIDNTLWEIHEDLTEGRNAATINRVLFKGLYERENCHAEVLFISNNALWNKTRHKLVRNSEICLMMLGKSNQKVVIRILEDKQKFLKEFANRSAADVTFVVNGEECKGDREYLAGLSPVFKAMLYGQFAEAQQDKIVLEEIESVGIFKDFLLAVSPLRIQPNPSNVDALLKLARQYDVPILMHKCENHLMSCYEISLADRILLAGEYGLDSLRKRTMLQLSNDDFQEMLKEKSKQLREPESNFLFDIIADRMQEMQDVCEQLLTENKELQKNYKK